MTGATRLGAGTGALLRCGCVEWPAGAHQLGFATPQYALVWTASGAGVYRDASGKRWPLEPGDAFQRFPNAPHDVITAGASRWWYVAVPSTILAALQQMGIGTLASPVMPVGQDPRLPARFLALVRRLRACPEGDLPSCLASMLELIVELHRRAGAAKAADPHRGAIEAACRRIDESPSQRLAPQTLARAAGMGYHAFRKAFATRMGCGVAAWSLRRRLTCAQELLAERGLSVAEVARRVGYDDPLQFSAIFRRHYGVSPRRWRRGA